MIDDNNNKKKKKNVLIIVPLMRKSNKEIRTQKKEIKKEKEQTDLTVNTQMVYNSPTCKMHTRHTLDSLSRSPLSLS